MAAADWEEVRQLAADFQRAQLSQSAHKLSDRNCIEIVNKLVKLGHLDVIYTTDGREYLTPQHLETEIRDELTVSGGRINLVDLQQILNVDLSHIEGRVSEILRTDRNFTLIQGELIDRDYLDRAAEEINETLQEAGQVTIADLSKTFGLPADFLLSEIEQRIGSQIHGQLDPLDRGIIFTQAFVDRNVSKIRGIFSAITRPTQVSSLVSHFKLPEKLFYNVLDTLVRKGRIAGSIQGRQDKAIFIPEIYTKTQNAWIDSFFAQNGYVEYDTLTKVGISDGKQYIKKRFNSKDMLFLQTCCVGRELQDQIESSIEEALSSGTWVNIQPLLPSPFTEEDGRLFLQHCLKGSSRSSLQTFCGSIVTSPQFLSACKKFFEPRMNIKARQDVQMSPALFAELSKEEKAHLTETKGDESRMAKREERHKKASQGGGQKGGSGRGGRETKTKKVKSKFRGRGQVDDDDDEMSHPSKHGDGQNELKFLDQQEIEEVLKVNLTDCGVEFIEELACYLIRPLQRDYQDVAKAIFLSASGNTSAHKRKAHSEYKEKICGLWNNINIFSRGLDLFEDDTRLMLTKHLLKTVGQDIVNCIFEMVASEHLMSLDDNETFTQESRLKLLNRLSGEVKTPLTKLNTSLTSKDIGDFFDYFDVIAGPQFCDLNIRKLDKKKERQLIFNHRQALYDQLQRELEPAMVLHLTVVLLTYVVSKCIIHAPGRCVPQIIQYLKGHVDSTVYRKLNRYQELVMKQLISGQSNPSDVGNDIGSNDADERKPAVLLAEGLQEIKDLVLKTDNLDKDK